MALAPKGLSVRPRIPLIALRVCSASKEPVAKIHKPPALETAATIFGTLIQLIPDKIMGYLMPKSSVIRVFINKISPQKIGIAFSWRVVVPFSYTKLPSGGIVVNSSHRLLDVLNYFSHLLYLFIFIK